MPYGERDCIESWGSCILDVNCTRNDKVPSVNAYQPDRICSVVLLHNGYVRTAASGFDTNCPVVSSRLGRLSDV
jgi:hypothetical protein